MILSLVHVDVVMQLPVRICNRRLVKWDRMIDDRLKIKQRRKDLILILAVSTLVSIIAYAVWLITNSDRADGHGALQARQASANEEMLLQAAKAKALHCPKSQGAILQPSPQTGHHRVILTWNASAPSADGKLPAGYCLYRIAAKDLAKLDKQCGNCEQVNQKPILGTACIDDLVQDGAKYYYVATAINANGIASSLSNHTLAEIPSTAQAKSFVSPAYPSCRAENGTP